MNAHAKHSSAPSAKIGRNTYRSFRCITMPPELYGSLVTSTSPGSQWANARVPACIGMPIIVVAPLP